jgi:hypothetical protein
LKTKKKTTTKNTLFRGSSVILKVKKKKGKEKQNSKGLGRKQGEW